MSSKLLSMLSNAEETFLSSILKDDKNLDDFVTSWTHISDVVMLAVNQNSLTDEVLHMAQSVAARINILASSFLELSERTETISQSLQEDLNSAFATLNMDDNQEAIATPKMHQIPSYVKAAQQWLLENIHNPYPTKTTKLQLSRQTSCAVKDIDNWFSAARKRIGWNTLRSSHFANNRAQIIAAATAFFKPVNSSSNKSESVSSMSPVEVALLEIEYNAKHLCDFIPDAKLSEPVRRRRRHPAYPSPEPSERSNESSPELDLLPPSSTRDTDTRKRKRSTIEDAIESDFSTRKRVAIRNMTPSSSSSSPQSCQSILHDLRSTSGRQPSTSSHRKRKRSESPHEPEYAQESRKRPCQQRSTLEIPIDIPTMDIYSGSLSGEWTFPTEMPSPVSIFDGQEINPLDISVYKYDFSPCGDTYHSSSGSVSPVLSPSREFSNFVGTPLQESVCVAFHAANPLDENFAISPSGTLSQEPLIFDPTMFDNYGCLFESSDFPLELQFPHDLQCSPPYHKSWTGAQNDCSNNLLLSGLDLSSAVVNFIP